MVSASRRRVLSLIAIMIGISAILAGLALVVMYRLSLQDQCGRLIELAHSQARTIEAVGRFDGTHSIQGPAEDTLSQIREAHAAYKGFGRTGEFTLARRDGDRIVFLLRHRHGADSAPASVPFDSAIAQPMWRALQGQSGWMEGLDYRGERVLAAYEPVEGMGWGIVAKMDLAEIRAPLIRLAWLAAGVTAVLVFVGTVLLMHITHPLIDSLQESKERHRAIAESAKDAIITADYRGCVQFWNASAEAIFGYTAGEAVGRNLLEIIVPPQYHQAKKEAFARFARTGEGQAMGKTLELTALRQDGTEFPIEISLSRYRGSDGFVGVALIRDITDRKRAEAELMQAKEAAEVANRAKSEFLANMSHEIRTPLTAILGFAELTADEILSCHECATHKECLQRGSSREAVETIRRNGEYLLRIINDVLDLSKIEAGKLAVERIAVSPQEIVAEVASLARVRVQSKGLHLQVEYQGPVPEIIYTDPTRLRQILLNLLSNAIKFTEVGEVRLVTRCIQEEGESPRMRFDVMDTGIGMNEQAVASLFHPFTQADTSITRRAHGTGLGLTISRRLAMALGGDVRLIRTQPGAGSHFRVTVAAGPIAGIPAIDASAPAGAIIHGSRRADSRSSAAGRLDGRILLAEDGPDNQRLIAHVLRRAGAQVTVADNGQAALDAVAGAQRAGEPFDAILMDMQMPVMDGYEATRRLREQGYEAPIIALTAHAMAGDREKCLQVGCDDYVSKPIDRAKLIEVIRQRQIACRSLVV